MSYKCSTCMADIEEHYQVWNEPGTGKAICKSCYDMLKADTPKEPAKWSIKALNIAEVFLRYKSCSIGLEIAPNGR